MYFTKCTHISIIQSYINVEYDVFKIHLRKKMFENLIITEATEKLEINLKQKSKKSLQETIPIKSVALFQKTGFKQTRARLWDEHGS